MNGLWTSRVDTLRFEKRNIDYCNKVGEKTHVLDPPAAIAAMPGASGGHLELNVAWKVSQGKNGTPGTKRRAMTLFRWHRKS